MLRRLEVGRETNFITDKSGALFLDLDRDDDDDDSKASLPEQQACGVDDGEGECLASSAPKNEDSGDDTIDAPSKPASMAAFRHVALMSAVPLVAAELMGLGQGMSKDETLRVIRDIYLAKDEGEYVCGWHVDDRGFWPAQASSPGINAWISVDDVPPGPGGTFALAVGSHTADWKDDAHKAIGSVMTYPEDGFKDAQDMVKNRPGGTCNLESAAPETLKRWRTPSAYTTYERVMLSSTNDGCFIARCHSIARLCTTTNSVTGDKRVATKRSHLHH